MCYTPHAVAAAADAGFFVFDEESVGCEELSGAEADVPAEATATEASPWLSRSDEHSWWTSGPEATPTKGPLEAHRLG